MTDECTQCGCPIPAEPRPQDWWHDHLSCMAKSDFKTLNADTRNRIMLSDLTELLRNYDGNCPDIRKRKSCGCKEKDHDKEIVEQFWNRQADHIALRLTERQRKSDLANYGFFG
jgi:hypothetical protein